MKLERFGENIITSIMNILTFGYSLISVSVHRDMTRENYDVKCLKKATYREWLREVKKITWYVNPLYDSSLFTGEDAYLHADIYRFKDVGYLLTGFGFLLSKIYIRRYIKKYLQKPYIN